MDHAGITTFNHYGIGGFDVMSGGGFQGVPSLYNPWFRHARNWFIPDPINSNGAKTLQDFQTSGKCYVYNPTSLPINSISNEKFYISYHFPTNQFYNTWPYKDRNLGGVLIWHVKKDNPSIYDSYSDYRKLDIDIEAAHGKYVWQEYSDRVTNTGVANALVGRDSLEIRKIVGGIEVQGPYYLKDKGSASIFYTPNDGNNFTFYSNPNSNWYVNSSAENYAQNIPSGFSMKNLRNDNGTIKADFYINDFTIIQNTTLAVGKWYINNSITVSPNVTLTIQPGTILSFSNGASLIVNGTLNAIGTPSNKITFDRSGATGTWGSIIFDGSAASGSILDNVEIKYASDVRCLNQANVTIKNSLFDNCINGIYVYNSAPVIKFNNINEPQQNGIYGQTGGYQPNIQDNVIKKTSSNSSYHNYQGLWFYSNSSVYTNHNDVSGFYWGAYIGGGSYASFYYSSKGLYPYNRLINNLYGIAAGYGSTITANWIVGDGGNSIYNNTYYDAYCYNNSTIYGQKNYWGGGNPKQSSYNNSYIYIDPILTEDPWEWQTPPLPLASIENNSVQEDIIQLSYQSINKENQFDELSAVFTGLELENEKQVDQAIEFYKNLIANDKLVIFSLNKLIKLQNEYTGKDITSYLKELTKSKKYGSLANKLLGNIYLQSGQFADAITIYNSIIENYPADYQSISARFEKLFAYLNIKKDKAEANKILTEIKIMNLKEDEWAMLIDAADNLINESVNKLTLPKQYTNTENIILTKYNLSQNYPNPFNPTTLLNYSVKETGLVKIKVYDILGSEVAELVNETKEAGDHSVEFNASNLPSGVYIYTLQVNGYSASRKMLLLK